MSQVKQLIDFANQVLNDWPELCDLDAFEIQDIAEKHGLLVPEIRHEPCGEECMCATMGDGTEFIKGMKCFHKAEFLLAADIEEVLVATYQRPELTDADKATAERDCKALIKKYGYNNLPKILAALAVENVRLVKEIQEHRAARGIDPLPVFKA